MGAAAQGRLERIFRFVIAKRWWIVAIYAAVVPVAAWLAAGVPQDDSIDRLIVRSDPDAVANEAFEKVFGSGEYAILLVESADPFTPEALGRFAALERALDSLPKVDTSSALSIFQRTRGGPGASPGRPPTGPPASAHAAAAEPTAERAEAFRRFATGTEIFRRQGLIGDGFLGLPLILHVAGPEERRSVLTSLESAIAPFENGPEGAGAIRKVGGLWVNAWLERETAASVTRYFPLFGLFIIVLNLALYRSVRTLAAFLATIGASVALTVGYVGATGGVLTIVSSLVPMTVLITCTATLVYIHSRFVDRPEGASFEDHQVFALTNKFLPCTASVFATAVGFAALAVSKIRPIREMGIWVAVGLGFTWLAVFTLFPALQRILRTPTRRERATAGHAGLERLAARLPGATYRWRWVLVPGALALSAAGAAALLGVPGVLAPMPLETDALEYIDHDSAVYRDTKRFERVIAGLSVTEIWLRGAVGIVSEPAVVRGLDRFSETLEAEEGIGAVVGPTTILRMIRYVGGGGDRLPEDPAELEALCAALETLATTEPALAAFVDPGVLSQTHLSVVTRSSDERGFRTVEALIRDRWARAAAAEPALGGFSLAIAGQGPLEAKIASHMVPTLVESFALTVTVIFVTFLLVFRSGAARLLAMIPSVFAILVMFAVMRVSGIGLNVATILIASTVLGTSENDQIHFFYHFLEKGSGASLERKLRHTLVVAGGAIAFATLINAGGFLAFALSDLPPMRQFGTLAALAFTLSMIADFTALPAALWIFYREKPDVLLGAPRPDATRQGGSGRDGTGASPPGAHRAT